MTNKNSTDDGMTEEERTALTVILTQEVALFLQENRPLVMERAMKKLRAFRGEALKEETSERDAKA